MNNDNDRGKIIGRRAVLLGGGKLALLSALIGRMYYLQVLQADKYATLADQNRISLQLIPPDRGRILDRNGVPMAINQQNFQVMIVSEQTDDLDDTLDSLGEIIPLSEHDRARIVREVKRHRDFVPVLVRENLTWEEVSRIEINTPDLPGVTIEKGQSRSYPLGGLGAHVLGYVSPVAETDLQGSSDPLLELPGFRIGKAGIERIYDLSMRGKGGSKKIEVNAVGRPIRELERDEAEPGRDLTLTLDLDLQRFAAQRLGSESGSVVVIDIHTGEILVLASTPSFDPNGFNRGLTSEEWNDLTRNPRLPLNNKAIAGQYAPGSTFKTMVALAALENGIITKEHTVTCGGELTLGNYTWHCDKAHGVLDLKNGIARSCDVYFWDVARKVGIDLIAEMAKRFGLGARLDIDLPNEASGLIPSRAWKRATYGVPWTPGEDLNAGIGQGYVLATPLQLAVQAARLANGGFAVRPYLSRDRIEGRLASPRAAGNFPSLGLSQASLATVVDAMVAVCQPGGTGWPAHIADPAMAMGGKTGTAQVHHLGVGEHHIEGGKKPENQPWKMRDHAHFIAFAPVGAPRFACAVVVEHGGWAAEMSAPIARDVLIEVQKRYPARVAADRVHDDHG